MEADYIIKRDQEVIGFYRYNVTLLKGATGRYIISHEGLFTKKATSRSDAMHAIDYDICNDNSIICSGPCELSGSTRLETSGI